MVPRILSSLITLVIVCVVSFAAIELAPGEPEELLLGAQARDMPPETIERIAGMYRFDRPSHERFFAWTASVLSGDLGVSLKSNRPVLEEFLVRIPVSFTIAAGAIALGAVLGLLLGILSVLYEKGPVDQAIRITSVICSSFPVFLVGLLFLYIFSYRLGWFPLYGTGKGSGFVLPIFTLGGMLGISLSRIVRNSLLGAIHAEYFLTALGKGLTYNRAVVMHALRNAMTPSITFLSLRFAGLLGGIVLIESVFSLPGMGSYIFEAIFSRDYPVIQGYILFFGGVVVVVNLGADIIARYIDPRPTQSGIQ